jgi:hypothetical protein
MKYFVLAVCLGLALGISRASAMSPKAVQCNSQADAKGLHGKDRRVFRAKCVQGRS